MIINSLSFDFSLIGSDALTVALVGYVTVFVALVVLFLLFLNLPRLINFELRNRMKRKGKEVKVTPTAEQASGEENAAIAAALFLYFNQIHDEESNIVTIKKTSKLYSPWSSKIYGLNKFDKDKWKQQ